ncbi:MAG: hypothetical protein AVDCRST_MAG18-5150 [uncultured Thermomicrobiales bacterium]|uniref:Nudix hydrolase domain-containing protein n=1 Tax=uncultured Thermomicrobiales bacterium TaxID=1645740 RepID=A0A6N3IPK1_9BACT|nr:MAG: hypothetical protein AVDCRST_MAG18-5150 [uncultured Thermomicrobiales bacterium]
MGEVGPESASERVEWDGRVATVTWLAPPYRPSRRLTTQALGLCFTIDGRIVLVSGDGEQWTLPGGPPEVGESLEAALERDLREEASARLIACEYIGCQRVEDRERPDGPTLYYQARFWARVELYPFDGAEGTSARRLVTPETFRDTLTWGGAIAARMILAAGLTCERARAHFASQD